MKYILILVALTTAACSNSGGGSGSSSGSGGATGGTAKSCATWMNGTAKNDSNHQVIGLFSDCTGYNESCGDTYLYEVTYSDNSQVQFKLTISGPQNCDVNGTYTCTAVRSASVPGKYSVACGTNPAYIYTRMAQEY